MWLQLAPGGSAWNGSPPFLCSSPRTCWGRHSKQRNDTPLAKWLQALPSTWWDCPGPLQSWVRSKDKPCEASLTSPCLHVHCWETSHFSVTSLFSLGDHENKFKWAAQRLPRQFLIGQGAPGERLLQAPALTRSQGTLRTQDTSRNLFFQETLIPQGPREVLSLPSSRVHR